MRKLKFIISCFCLTASLLGLLLLLWGLGSYCDDVCIRNNARESLKILAEEGDYYSPYLPVGMVKRDNFTDAFIISGSAAEVPEMSEFENILYSPVFSANVKSTTKACYNAYIDSVPPYYHAWSYARYWHGYKVIVRPLLSIMNIRGIRILNIFIGLALFACALLLINKKVGFYYALIFAFSMPATGFPLLLTNIQFTTCYFLAFAGIITVCLLKDKYLSTDVPYFIFPGFGALTSFFDFLTAPLLSLGLPLIVILLRRNRFPDWKFLIYCIILWGAGYAGMWSSKWILAGIFLPDDIFENVTQAITLRTSGVNLDSVIYFRLTIVLGLLTLLLLGLAARLRAYTGNENFKRYIPLMIIAFLPLLWILVLRNHSFVHYWYVWRIFAVTIMGAGCFSVKLLSTSNK